jgi:uncharacterized integral membrane protein (TIGR00698 family)
MPKILLACGVALCVAGWASPAAALILGIAIALGLGNPWPRASRAASRPLLQGSVILLGFGMDLSTVLRAGARGFGFAAATIAATFALAALLRRMLDVDPTTSALIASGTAICGGSAIAAVGSVLDADENAMSVAMGTVFLLNGVALLVFPPIGRALRLSPEQFGTWAGVAIHDVSSVVGASSTFGLAALSTATAVKLSRALWIAPLALAFSAHSRRRRPDQARRGAAFPYFILLFVAAAALRSAFPAVAPAASVLTRVARAGFTLTLLLIGAGVSAATVKRVGWRPLAQGLALWIFLSSASLLAVTRLR